LQLPDRPTAENELHVVDVIDGVSPVDLPLKDANGRLTPR
jgi:hypothetical protein